MRSVLSISIILTLIVLFFQANLLQRLTFTQSLLSIALEELSNQSPEISKETIPGETKTKDLTDDKDKNCPFRNTPIYRSIYVYPSPGDADWSDDILSDYGKSRNITWPWIAIDRQTKEKGTVHYDTRSPGIQYNTELLVRDVITHPDSCLRTYDPEQATLFYVPYLPSIEYHNGTLSLGDYSTSPFGAALMDATEGNFKAWEETFGLSSKYWERRGGSDHILVMSEPLHGLWHPKSRRGSFHFINSQKQLTPPIVISVELSTTFVEMYPNCARKNIVVPYPNTDGKWFNGKLDEEAVKAFARVNLANATHSTAALEVEKHLSKSSTDSNPRQRPRPLAQFYRAGNHGTCRNLRAAMKDDYMCSESGKVSKQHKLNDYALSYRQATFCPCPGGDSPSAKRMFDALHAGCIPIVLSEDYVWPYTSEFDTVGNQSDSILLNPKDFSIRLESLDYDEARHNESCHYIAENQMDDLQSFMETISEEEILRLRQGAQKATDTYAYYKRRADLPDNPLREGVLPDGGASHALIGALAERAKGKLWPACKQELELPRGERPDPAVFKC
jgi:hypothetical protein